jgi:hypothetical protein
MVKSAKVERISFEALFFPGFIASNIRKMKAMGGRETGRLAVVLCVAVLLAATLAQSAHICGLPSPNLGRGPQFSSLVSANGPCLICMMGHSATITLLLLILLLPATRKGPRQRVDPRPRALLEAFRLYVRPPPAF